MHALVTGASHGLGSTLRKHLEERGHTVTDMPGEVIKNGKWRIDEFIQNQSMRPDIIINNYGINHLSWIGDIDIQDEMIVQVNLLGPLWVVNAAKQKWNRPMRVVNIASQTYRVPQRTTALYCASKAGLVMLTKVMARELAPHGWVINAVAPGKIEDTEMSQLTDAQVNELRGWDKPTADLYALSQIPAGRFTDRAEVAEAVMRLLDMPSYVNGTVLEVMGGV